MMRLPLSLVIKFIAQSNIFREAIIYIYIYFFFSYFQCLDLGHNITGSQGFHQEATHF